jgi:hypothetical protein
MVQTVSHDEREATDHLRFVSKRTPSLKSEITGARIF